MSATSHPELNGDWHVHSQFSDDATSTMSENIRVAAERGIRHLRLIDHVRVSTTWVPEFLAAVAAERVFAPDSLTVHTGVEAKILDASGRLDIPSDLVVGPGGVDGIVIADHQFPSHDGPWTPERTRAELAAGLSTTDALATLVHATIGAMKLAPGGQLAHPFSILPKIGISEDELPDDLLAEWADAAAATGTSIEVNEKWACPGARAIRAARAAGATVVAATDSHVAEDVGRYDRVVALLDAAGAGETA
ncbi:MAG: PHP domain-containing protein [Leifsonia flava]